MSSEFKKLFPVLTALTVLTALVILKSTPGDRFSGDVQEIVKAYAENGISVSPEQFNQKDTNYIIVNLGKGPMEEIPANLTIIDLPFEKISFDESLELLKEQSSAILLYSKNPAQAAKAFVILSQLGVNNLKIIDNEFNNEEFKYNFQLDSIR
jgi:hypothetical protein